MHPWLVTAVGFLALSACSMESGSDRDTKARLVGSWYYELKDPSERSIRGSASLRPDGSFEETIRVSGENVDEVARGAWHVTDGLLKLDSTERNGKKLGTLDDRYRTCSVSNVSASAFTCTDANGMKLDFRKTTDGRQSS